VFEALKHLHKTFVGMRLVATNKQLRAATPSERAELEKEYASLRNRYESMYNPDKPQYDIDAIVTGRKTEEMPYISKDMPRDELVRVLIQELQKVRSHPELTEAKRRELEARVQKYASIIHKKEG